MSRTAMMLAMCCDAYGCDRGSNGSAPSAPAHTTAADAIAQTSGSDAGARPRATTVSDAMAPAVTAAPGARTVYQGRAEGRGVDAPIHEFYTRITADPWTGTGTVRLEVPEGDGAVTGSVTFGALTFEGRGFRTGNHVRVTLEQNVPARDGGGPPPEDVFRGTIDGEIAANAVRGTWEASAEAGVKRRRGTIEAQRQ